MPPAAAELKLHRVLQPRQRRRRQQRLPRFCCWLCGTALGPLVLLLPYVLPSPLHCNHQHYDAARAHKGGGALPPLCPQASCPAAAALCEASAITMICEARSWWLLRCVGWSLCPPLSLCDLANSGCWEGAHLPLLTTQDNSEETEARGCSSVLIRMRLRQAAAALQQSQGHCCRRPPPPEFTPRYQSLSGSMKARSWLMSLFGSGTRASEHGIADAPVNHPIVRREHRFVAQGTSLCVCTEGRVWCCTACVIATLCIGGRHMSSLDQSKHDFVTFPAVAVVVGAS